MSNTNSNTFNNSNPSTSHLDDEEPSYTEFIKQKHRVDTFMHHTEQQLEKRSRDAVDGGAASPKEQQDSSDANQNDKGDSKEPEPPLQHLFANIHHNLSFLSNSDWPSLRNHLESYSQFEFAISKISSRLENLERDCKRVRMRMGFFFDSEERIQYLKAHPEKEIEFQKESQLNATKQKQQQELTEAFLTENHELKTQLRTHIKRELEVETRLDLLQQQLKEKGHGTGSSSIMMDLLSTSALIHTPDPTMISLDSPTEFVEESGKEGVAQSSEEDTTTTQKSSKSDASSHTVTLPSFAPIEKVSEIDLNASLDDTITLSHRNELKSFNDKLNGIESTCKMAVHDKLKILGKRLRYFQQNRAKSAKRQKGPKKSPLTFVFLQIFGSNVLWQEHPSDMERAMTLFLHTLREQLEKHSGYENSGEGDRFLCVFTSPKAALKFVKALQLNLLNIAYPDSLLHHDLCKEEMYSDSTTGEAVTVFKGFRVSAVVQSCDNLVIRKNQFTLRDEYFGLDIQYAARLIHMLDPGQIAVLPSTEQLLVKNKLTEEVLQSTLDLSLKAGKKLSFASYSELVIAPLAARSTIDQSAIMELPLGEAYHSTVESRLDDLLSRLTHLDEIIKSTQYRQQLEMELEAQKKIELNQENAKSFQKTLTRNQLMVDNVIGRLLQKLNALKQFVESTEKLFTNHESISIMDKIHHQQHITLDSLKQQVTLLKSKVNSSQKKKSKKNKQGVKKDATLRSPTASNTSGKSLLLPKNKSYDERLLNDSDTLPSLSPSNVEESRKRLPSFCHLLHRIVKFEHLGLIFQLVVANGSMPSLHIGHDDLVAFLTQTRETTQRDRFWLASVAVDLIAGSQLLRRDENEEKWDFSYESPQQLVFSPLPRSTLCIIFLSLSHSNPFQFSISLSPFHIKSHSSLFESLLR